MNKEDKQEKLVPELRFREFSENWLISKLKNETDFKQGVQVGIKFQSKEKNELNNIPFIRIENYTQDSKDFRYIPFERGKHAIVGENDIVAVRYGATAGYINRGLSGILANNLFTIKPRNKSLLENNLLFILLRKQSSYNYFQSGMAGGAMPALSFGIIGNLTIAFPKDTKEQQKISSFLSLIDKKIELLNKKKDLLEIYKKGIMQKIFSREIRFKDSNGNDYPEWEEKKLGEVVKVISSRIYEIKSSEILESGKYPVVDQSPDLISGFSNSIENVFTNSNCIIYGDHTTVVKYIDFDFIVGADGTKILQVSTPKVLAKYLYFNLLKRNIRPEGYKRHWSIAKKIKINIPTISEQKQISEVLTLLARQEELNNICGSRISSFKNSLLQKMFI